MNFDFVVGLIVGIVFTIVLLIIMGMLYAAGNADDESDVFYQEHLKTSISKREKEENTSLFCESPGCNNELSTKQEKLDYKCTACKFP